MMKPRRSLFVVAMVWAAGCGGRSSPTGVGAVPAGGPRQFRGAERRRESAGTGGGMPGGRHVRGNGRRERRSRRRRRRRGGRGSGGAPARAVRRGPRGAAAAIERDSDHSAGERRLSDLRDRNRHRGGARRHLAAGRAKSQGTGPLLFYWHGTGRRPAEVNALVPAAVRQEILSQGGIIVSFQGSLGTGGDCSGTATFSRDDFKVADQIAACAVRDYGIDPRRIFTTGCSAGGLQAGCMGAMRSSYIAAVAPNSGGEVTRQTIQDPTRVPAVMTMHGGSSDMVIVSFATTSATYDTQMKGAGCVRRQLQSRRRPLSGAGGALHRGLAIHEGPPVRRGARALRMSMP